MASASPAPGPDGPACRMANPNGAPPTHAARIPSIEADSGSSIPPPQIRVELHRKGDRELVARGHQHRDQHHGPEERGQQRPRRPGAEVHAEEDQREQRQQQPRGPVHQVLRPQHQRAAGSARPTARPARARRSRRRSARTWRSSPARRTSRARPRSTRPPRAPRKWSRSARPESSFSRMASTKGTHASSRARGMVPEIERLAHHQRGEESAGAGEGIRRPDAGPTARPRAPTPGGSAAAARAPATGRAPPGPACPTTARTASRRPPGRQAHQPRGDPPRGHPRQRVRRVLQEGLVQRAQARGAHRLQPAHVHRRQQRGAQRGRGPSPRRAAPRCASPTAG